LVVQLIVAPVAVIPEDVTAEITGAVVSLGVVTVTEPPEPLVVTALLAASAATMPVMPTGMDAGLVPLAMLSRTMATAPEPIEVVLSAKTNTRAPPEIALPLADFPAAVAAAPVVVET
jgi:hypothetical protein